MTFKDPCTIALELDKELMEIHTNRSELEDFLYEKCRQDPDLLATIVSDYVTSLSDNKLIELEDFLVNNFGDN